MFTVPLVAYDAEGALLPGLTPTWYVWLNAYTGVAAAEPSITARGLGEYGVVDAPEGECGILDFGVTAAPRYVFIGSLSYEVIAAFDSAGAPLAGLTPVWVTHRNQAGADVLPQATFTSLGSGLYRIDTLSDGITGLVDLGVTAVPRRLLIGNEQTDGDEELPVISNLSPADGTSIARTDSISFDLTDNQELGRILIAVKYARFNNATELVWDGTTVLGPHTVDITAIEGGWHFEVARTTGWPAAPTIYVYAADVGGNEVV